MQNSSLTKSVLFYRHFDVYSGGHQKVFDYFSHLEDSSIYSPSIAFSPSSVWDSSNPWFPQYQLNQSKFDPKEHDFLFLAGMDWQTYEEIGMHPERPVINLIQHVRHAVPGQNVHRFLKNKAIRICVSQEVKDAIDSTGMVNGPTFAISNGIGIPAMLIDKEIDFFIAGFKNADLAKEIQERLSKERLKVVCLTKMVNREVFLEYLASAKIAVMLPLKTEGFYLPALEAMKLSNVAIVPDCVGNRSFCSDIKTDSEHGNCLMPDYGLEAILDACLYARSLLKNNAQMEALKNAVGKTLSKHTLAGENEQFLAVMAQVNELW